MGQYIIDETVLIIDNIFIVSFAEAVSPYNWYLIGPGPVQQREGQQSQFFCFLVFWQNNFPFVWPAMGKCFLIHYVAELFGQFET